MHRIDNPTAATSLPTPKPFGPEGYFTAGNPNTGQLATIVEYDWLNSLQEELCNIVARGGLTDDKSDNTQVLKALSNLFTAPLTQVAVTQNLLVPAWATQIYFEMCGAGGGGCHCQSNGTTYTAGAGGGSGAYARAQRAVTPGQLVNVIIGTGQGQEADGQSSSIAFGSSWTVTCTGGVAGGWVSGNDCGGGYGGTASGADMNVAGNYGDDGQLPTTNTTVYPQGNGGGGPWGGTARAGIPQGPSGGGAPGGGPGAGGGGVYDPSNTGVYHPGGGGADGIVYYRFLP